MDYNKFYQRLTHLLNRKRKHQEVDDYQTNDRSSKKLILANNLKIEEPLERQVITNKRKRATIETDLDYDFDLNVSTPKRSHNSSTLSCINPTPSPKTLSHDSPTIADSNIPNSNESNASLNRLPKECTNYSTSNTYRQSYIIEELDLEPHNSHEDMEPYARRLSHNSFGKSNRLVNLIATPIPKTTQQGDPGSIVVNSNSKLNNPTALIFNDNYDMDLDTALENPHQSNSNNKLISNSNHNHNHANHDMVLDIENSHQANSNKMISNSNDDHTHAPIINCDNNVINNINSASSIPWQDTNTDMMDVPIDVSSTPTCSDTRYTDLNVSYSSDSTTPTCTGTCFYDNNNYNLSIYLESLVSQILYFHNSFIPSHINSLNYEYHAQCHNLQLQFRDILNSRDQIIQSLSNELILNKYQLDTCNLNLHNLTLHNIELTKFYEASLDTSKTQINSLLSTIEQLQLQQNQTSSSTINIGNSINCLQSQLNNLSVYLIDEISKLSAVIPMNSNVTIEQLQQNQTSTSNIGNSIICLQSQLNNLSGYLIDEISKLSAVIPMNSNVKDSISTDILSKMTSLENHMNILYSNLNSSISNFSHTFTTCQATSNKSSSDPTTCTSTTIDTTFPVHVTADNNISSSNLNLSDSNTTLPNINAIIEPTSTNVANSDSSSNSTTMAVYFSTNTADLDMFDYHIATMHILPSNSKRMTHVPSNCHTQLQLVNPDHDQPIDLDTTQLTSSDQSNSIIYQTFDTTTPSSNISIEDVKNLNVNTTTTTVDETYTLIDTAINDGIIETSMDCIHTTIDVAQSHDIVNNDATIEESIACINSPNIDHIRDCTNNISTSIYSTPSVQFDTSNLSDTHDSTTIVLPSISNSNAQTPNLPTPNLPSDQDHISPNCDTLTPQSDNITLIPDNDHLITQLPHQTPSTILTQPMQSTTFVNDHDHETSRSANNNHDENNTVSSTYTNPNLDEFILIGSIKIPVIYGTTALLISKYSDPSPTSVTIDNTHCSPEPSNAPPHFSVGTYNKKASISSHYSKHKPNSYNKPYHSRTYSTTSSSARLNTHSITTLESQANSNHSSPPSIAISKTTNTVTTSDSSTPTTTTSIAADMDDWVVVGKNGKHRAYSKTSSKYLIGGGSDYNYNPNRENNSISNFTRGKTKSNKPTCTNTTSQSSDDITNLNKSISNINLNTSSGNYSTIASNTFIQNTNLNSWHKQVNDIYGLSNDKSTSVKLVLNKSTKLSTLASIFTSPNPKESFISVLTSGKIKLIYYLKHDSTHSNSTIGCGLCFQRCELQLEKRALSEDKRQIPADLDLSIQSNRSYLIDYINHNSSPSTKHVEKQVIRHLNQHPYILGFPKQFWQGIEFSKSWAKGRNHKTLFIRESPRSKYSTLVFSAALHKESNFVFTLDEIKFIITNGWNRYCLANNHYFLLPYQETSIDIDRLDESINNLFSNYLKIFNSIFKYQTKDLTIAFSTSDDNYSTTKPTIVHDLTSMSTQLDLHTCTNLNATSAQLDLTATPTQLDPHIHTNIIATPTQSDLNITEHCHLTHTLTRTLSNTNSILDDLTCESSSVTLHSNSNKPKTTKNNLRNVTKHQIKKSAPTDIPKKVIDNKHTTTPKVYNTRATNSSPNSTTSPLNQPTNMNTIDYSNDTYTWEQISHYLILRPPTAESKFSSKRLQISRKLYTTVLHEINNATVENHNHKMEYYLKRLLLLPTWLFCKSEKDTIVISRAQGMLSNIWPHLTTKASLHQQRRKNRFATTKRNINTNKPAKEILDKSGCAIPDHIVKKSMKLLTSGLISKSFQTLTNKPTVHVTDAVIKKLQLLHPSPLHSLPSFPLESAKGNIHLKPQHVYAVSHSLEKGKAPGLTQLRSLHLKLLIGTVNDTLGQSFLTKLTTFLEHMINGLLCDSFYAAISTSILIPIAKDDSINPDIRPIALGDTLTKVAGKLLLQLSKDVISKLFHPIQLGIGITSATEIISHSVSAIRLRHPTWDVAQLDFRNAFNSISRNEALKQCLLHFPHIFPFINAMYNRKSILVIRQENNTYTTIYSQEGARQGDALGSLFFCLGCLPLIQSLRDKLSASTIFAYIDDITIIGPKDEITKAILLTTSDGANIGLHLNKSKCVILKSVNHKIDSYNDYGDIIPKERIFSTANNATEQGIVVLGTPIGSDVFMSNWINSKIAELQTLNDIILKFPNLQAVWLYLYYIINNKLTYLFRTIHPRYIKQYYNDLKSIILTTINKITGCNLTTQQYSYQIASLPIAKGGFGLNIHYLESKSTSAFLASTSYAFNFMVTTTLLNNEDTWFQESITSQFIEFSHLAGNRITYDDLINSLEYFSYKKLQRKLYNIVMESQSNIFRSSLPETIATRYINSVTTYTTKFLLAIPSWQDTIFSNDQFRITFKLKLLLPLLPDNLVLHCNCSKQSLIDCHGDHLLCCSNQNEWQYRHDLLVYGLADLAKDAGLFVKKDTTSNKFYKDNGDCLITDFIILNNPIYDGSTVAYDVSITHSSNNKSCSTAIQQRELTKDKQYLTELSTAGADFYPLVISSQGVFSDTTYQYILQMTKLIAERTNAPESTVFNNWIVRLSCLLHKSNATLLLHKIDRICSSSLHFPSQDSAFINYQVHQLLVTSM